MKRGFTLIELLIVVLIIGILAAVAVPQYQKTVAKSRTAELVLIVRDIAKSQERYYLQNEQFSRNFDNLDISMPAAEQWTTAGSGYNYVTTNSGAEIRIRARDLNPSNLEPTKGSCFNVEAYATAASYPIRILNRMGQEDKLYCYASKTDVKANALCAMVGKKRACGSCDNTSYYCYDLF